MNQRVRCDFPSLKLTKHDLPFAVRVEGERSATIALRVACNVVQEADENGKWRGTDSVGSLYPYRSAAENSDPPLTWKSAVRVNVGPAPPIRVSLVLSLP